MEGKMEGRRGEVEMQEFEREGRGGEGEGRRKGKGGEWERVVQWKGQLGEVE